jgi:hypothetical protein
VTITGNDPDPWDPPQGVCMHCGAEVGWRQVDRLAFSDDDQQVQYRAVCKAGCAGFAEAGEALPEPTNRYARWESRY